MVSGASRVTRRRPIARLGRFGWFVRCLIGLYLVSLGVAAQAAAPGERIDGGRFVLELCTGDGARMVVVDGLGHTQERHDGDHQVGHDCAACCIRCPPKALTARIGVPLVRPMAWAARIAEPHGALLHGRFTTRAPLPPRGPPALS